MGLTKIDDRGLKTPIDLQDNEKIRLGTGNDLELFHNGTNSHLKVTNGALVLNADSLYLQSLTEDYLTATANGAVKLYYNNSKKLETQVYGITVSGDVFLPDNNRFVSGTSNDIQLYHSGSDSFLLHIGTGDLKLQTNSGSIELNSANENIR